jgi:hypothetical protein
MLRVYWKVVFFSRAGSKTFIADVFVKTAKILRGYVWLVSGMEVMLDTVRIRVALL